MEWKFFLCALHRFLKKVFCDFHIETILEHHFVRALSYFDVLGGTVMIFFFTKTV